MADDHFTFLGYREYTLSRRGDGEVLAPVTGSGLGILRSDPPTRPGARRAAARRRRPRRTSRSILVLTKANSRSTVHRIAHLDYIGVKMFDDDGEVVGERRFLGLFAPPPTPSRCCACRWSPRRSQAVLDRSGVAPDSHSGKDLLEILETYPRDELFQASTDELLRDRDGGDPAAGAPPHQLFFREDDFGRFVSCLVYIPRDRYTTASGCGWPTSSRRPSAASRVDFTARVTESALARLQFVVRVPKGRRVRTLDRAELGRPRAAPRRGDPHLGRRFGDALRAAHGEEAGDRLMDRFGRAFPEAYKETFTVDQGLADLAHLDRLGDGPGHERRRSTVPADAPDDDPPVQALPASSRCSLSDILPVFSHMGVEVVDEQPVRGRPRRRRRPARLRLRPARARRRDWEACPHDRLRELFEDAFAAVWHGGPRRRLQRSWCCAPG